MSYYIVDPIYNVLGSHQPQTHHGVAKLVLLLNNNHLYPIFNEPVQNSIIHANQIKKEQLPTTNWYTSSNNFKYIDWFSEENETLIERIIMGTQEDTFHGYTIQFDNTGREDLSQLLIQIVDRTKCAFPTHHIKIERSKIVSFVHPISEKVFLLANNYEQREATMNFLHNLHPSFNFEFRNQSFTQIGMEIAKVLNCNIPKQSEYDNLSREIHDRLHKTIDCNIEERRRQTSF
jgi:hypothetical protein